MSLRKLPSIGALEAFLVVAERQSLKAAAPELNISISALSRRIQTLEAQLGLVLFERRARSLRLTEDGDALREGVWPSMETLQSFVAELKQRRAAPRPAE
jgi:LysR family glycine cleavage system transcriptional activator